MKRKISLALLVLLMTSALALCIFAQTQKDKQQGDVRKAVQEIDRFQEAKQKAVRDTLLIAGNAPTKNIILLLSGTRGDGKTEIIGCPIPFPSTALSKKQKVRVEMQDGTVQEIDLKKIKKMTVE